MKKRDNPYFCNSCGRLLVNALFVELPSRIGVSYLCEDCARLSYVDLLQIEPKDKRLMDILNKLRTFFKENKINTES